MPIITRLEKGIVKIVYIGKYFYPYFGGIETVSEQLCNGMAENGHDVSIVTCHEKLLSKKRYSDSGFEIIKLRNYGKVLSVPLCVWTSRLINDLSPDIVHFHLPNPLPLFVLKKIKATKVATYHASILNKGLVGDMYSRQYKKQLKLLDKVVVTSSNTAKEKNFLNLEVSPDKVITIPLGVKLEKLSNAIKEDGPIKLVFSGRLVEYKGLDYLVKAMVNLNAELVIIGDGPLKKTMLKLIKKLNLNNKIKFMLPMKRDELFKFVSMCDLFVLPSISEAEAFGMSALEAMSLGLPIVTTQLNSGTSEINVNGETGIIVKPKSVTSLAKGIEQILDKKLLEEMGQKARVRFEENYTLKKMIQAHLELYESFNFVRN